MRQLLVAIALFFLMGSYTAYQFDLDCHLSGFVQSLAEHAAQPDDCAAPSSLEAPYDHVVCPLWAVVPAPAVLDVQERTPRLLGREDEIRPPSPTLSGRVGPPRAPPCA